ncbi:hypothetical protein FHW83_006013 [Duganella sp. SG902]|nr:hypothetical protein [Duganella sp. SG902]
MLAILSGSAKLISPAKRALNFLISLELAQGIYGPNSRWQPANQSDLQNEADNSSDGTANGEESQPR